MAVPGGEDVYATLLLTDTYLPGALVLAHSLRDAGTKKKLAILVTLETVSVEVVTQLKSVYDYVIPVDRIRNGNPANLYLMDRPDLHSAFTKINLWKQTQFRKIVYIDADVVAYRAPDELFDISHPFSAAPDIGWPDLFNTGVMVLTPDIGEYYALLAMAERGISFDGADQGLLNMHFKNNYNRLSFTYNVTPSAHYQYIPAYRHFQSSINMVHFIGSDKPWFQGRDAHTGSGPFNEMMGRWWAVYDRHYRREATPQSIPSISISTPNSTSTSLPAPSGTTQQIHQTKPVPEIVQYFVKGEYQPKVSYVVPVGEPPQQGQGYHGQHYQSYDQHHHHEPLQFHQHQPDHPHHEQPHYGKTHDEQSHHVHQTQNQQHFHPHDQPHHEEHHHPHNESSETAHESHTEARLEQVHEHQQPTHHAEPEHKPEPPPQQPTWDAQRHAPPTDSKPEAANFPEMHYEMSNDTAPFVPPQRYPSPPKNMWYEVPKERPAAPAAPPRAIFPWETHRPRASRVFADLPPEPPAADEPKTEPTSEHAAPPESSPQASSGEPHSQGEGAGTSSNHVTPPASEVWSSFSNAWDDVPQIGQYVDKLQQRHRRTKSQGMNLGNLPPPSGLTQEDVNQRRGSKLTDFPTEVERPSLPVTPAPIRRPRFWGGGGPGTSIGAGEEDEDNELLPAAEGVPAQSEWVCAHGIRWSPADCLCDLANVLRYHKDPMAQLQKLAQQQSDLVLQKFGGSTGESTAEDESNTTGIEGREIPNRSLPFGSEDAKSPTYVAQSPTVHSPTPVKPGSGTSLAARLQSENDSTPRSTYEDGSTVMEEPSYHGPGAAFEKGEDYLTQDTPAPPTEEEQDVLDT